MKNQDLTDSTDVVRAIQSLRGSLNWTQRQLSCFLNVTETSINRYEASGSPPSVAVLLRLISLAHEAKRRDLARIFTVAVDQRVWRERGNLRYLAEAFTEALV
jgi:transcriptional regulator with XRE-family HTH domain